MPMLAITSIAIGAVLGLRFKVPVLLPAMAVTLGPILVGGIVRGDALWHVALAGVLVTTGVQLGYLGGTAIQHIVLLARAARVNPAWHSRSAR